MASLFKKIFGKNNQEYTENTTELPVEETKLILDNLNENEVEYIGKGLKLAEELFKELKMPFEQHLFEPLNIDTAIESWFTQDLGNRFGIDVNSYSNALACGWGNYLVDVLKMEWHVITDNFGTEIGLYHNSNNVTIFPFNSVAKAFNNKNFDLISIITTKTSEVIDQK